MTKGSNLSMWPHRIMAMLEKCRTNLLPKMTFQVYVYTLFLVCICVMMMLYASLLSSHNAQQHTLVNMRDQIEDMQRRIISNNISVDVRTPDVLLMVPPEPVLTQLTVFRRPIDLSHAEKREALLCNRRATAKYHESLKILKQEDMNTIKWRHHSYLTQSSVIFDIGGNLGDDSATFIKNYGSRIVIFEPLKSCYDFLRERFRINLEVKILNFALARANEKLNMETRGLNGVQSSLYPRNGTEPGELIQVRNATEIFGEIGLGNNSIDLLHMDCEGCELDILEAILETNLIEAFKNIQFASHSFSSTIRYPGYREKYCKIQELLRKTHAPSYRLMFVWENWKRVGKVIYS